MSDKRVSEMSDDEIRALAGASDPLTAARACVERFCNPPSYVGGPPDVRAAKELMPRLLAALDAVLELHARHPVRAYDLDLRCAAHIWIGRTTKEVMGCPDCTYRDRNRCFVCRAEWPCPIVQAITRALLGEEASDRG